MLLAVWVPDAAFTAFLQADLRFMVPMHVWHAWRLYFDFGVLGDPGTILGHWGAQEGTLGGPGLDFIEFLVDLV